MVPMHVLAAALLVAASAAAQSSRSALPARPFLTLDAANAAVAACRQLSEERGWRVAIAVMDAGGNLVAFARMDEARTMPARVAMLKAGTASMTGRSTLDLRHITFDEIEPSHGIEHLPGVVVIEGGEPIFSRSRVLVGGIGVSGATPAQDGECARAAIAAISGQL